MLTTLDAHVLINLCSKQLQSRRIIPAQHQAKEMIQPSQTSAHTNWTFLDLWTAHWVMCTPLFLVNLSSVTFFIFLFFWQSQRMPDALIQSDSLMKDQLYPLMTWNVEPASPQNAPSLHELISPRMKITASHRREGAGATGMATSRSGQACTRGSVRQDLQWEIQCQL